MNCDFPCGLDRKPHICMVLIAISVQVIRALLILDDLGHQWKIVRQNSLTLALRIGCEVLCLTVVARSVVPRSLQGRYCCVNEA